MSLLIRRRDIGTKKEVAAHRQLDDATAQRAAAGIGVGAMGSTVKNIERHLAAAGFKPGTVDGTFGNQTRAAVIGFQRAAGLAETGLVDAATWSQLRKAVFAARSGVSPAQRLNEKSSAVKKSEAMLKRLGRKPGKVDGLFTEATQRAVKRFQRKHGLTPTGQIGAPTMRTLQKVYDDRFNRVEKPKSIWRPNPNFGSRDGADIDALILHHTAGGTAEGAMATLKSRGISAHYVLDKDGTLYQTVADQNEAYHAGVAAIRGDASPTVNNRSIGIEIVNLGTGKDKFTEAQYRTLEKLVPYLMKKYKIPMANLLGHKDVALPKGRKTDPAPNFDFERIRRAARRVL